MRRSLSNIARAEWVILADALANARKDAGLTQSEVARRLGRRQGYIWKIENGTQRLDPLELLELCEAVGVSAQGIYNTFVEGVLAKRKSSGNEK